MTAKSGDGLSFISYVTSRLFALGMVIGLGVGAFALLLAS